MEERELLQMIDKMTLPIRGKGLTGIEIISIISSFSATLINMMELPTEDRKMVWDVVTHSVMQNFRLHDYPTTKMDA